MIILNYVKSRNPLCCLGNMLISNSTSIILWYYCCPWPESNVTFQALAPVWSLTSSLQSTSPPLCLSFTRRDPVGQIPDWRTSSANSGLRAKEPSRWFVPALAMESAVNRGVRNVLFSLQIYTIPVITCPLISSWSNFLSPSSHRWTSSSLWWQLWRSVLCVSLRLQGEDLPLLYLRWTQWWTALVLHLLWLWDGPEIFFLYREEWWAHVLIIIKEGNYVEILTLVVDKRWTIIFMFEDSVDFVFLLFRKNFLEKIQLLVPFFRYSTLASV